MWDVCPSRGGAGRSSPLLRQDLERQRTMVAPIEPMAPSQWWMVPLGRDAGEMVENAEANVSTKGAATPARAWLSSPHEDEWRPQGSAGAPTERTKTTHGVR